MQQVLQAYVEHHDRWFRTFQRTLSRRSRDSGIWEDGVLDLVSPADVHVRQELSKTGTDLPWGSRGDLEPYWRIMYAAYAEFLAITDPRGVFGSGIRPVRDVIRHCAEPSRKDALQEVIVFAGDQLRLRKGLPQRPAPIVRFTEVRVRSDAALVSNYDFVGKVLVSRETLPAAPADIEWAQDPSSGRWSAIVMPWQIEMARF